MHFESVYCSPPLCPFCCEGLRHKQRRRLQIQLAQQWKQQSSSLTAETHLTITQSSYVTLSQSKHTHTQGGNLSDPLSYRGCASRKMWRNWNDGWNYCEKTVWLRKLCKSIVKTRLSLWLNRNKIMKCFRCVHTNWLNNAHASSYLFAVQRQSEKHFVHREARTSSTYITGSSCRTSTLTRVDLRAHVLQIKVLCTQSLYFHYCRIFVLLYG